MRILCIRDNGRARSYAEILGHLIVSNELFSSVDYTLRGVDADDIIVCDEMAYMDPSLFFEVIVPLIEVNKALILGISTPVGDAFNFFSRMINLVNPGTTDPIFESIVIELACARCKRMNRAGECRHMLRELPSWKGAEKFELAKLIYGDAQDDTRQRESLGIAAGCKDATFEIKWIKRLSKRNTWQNFSPEYMPSHIFIGIDPNAGGSSQMAIISVAMVLDQLVVCIS